MSDLILLREVQIKNFRSHLDSKVVFDTGINLIAGRNGAGKSSILEAILVALYGPKPTGIRKDELVRLNSSGYSIVLRLEVNGEKITIKRSSNGESFLKGRETIEGDSRVNQWVEKHICPAHIFTGAIYVRQGEIDAIVRDDEGRERIIRRITRIDDYENAWKNLGTVIKMFEKEKEGFRAFLSQKDEILRQREEKRKKLEETRALIAEGREKIAKVEGLVVELEKRLRELDERKEKIDELERRLDRTLGDVKSLEEKRKLLEKQRDEAVEKLSQLERDVNELKNVEGKAKEFLELEKLYTKVSTSLKEADQRVADAEKEMVKIKTELEKLSEDAGKLEKIREEIEHLKKEIDKIEADFRLWESLKAKIERVKDIEDKLGREGYTPEKVEKLHKALQKAVDEQKHLQEAFKKLAAKKASLTTRGKQLQKAVEELKRAEGSCPTCGRELDDVQRREILERYREEIARIRKELEKLREVEKKLEDKKTIVEKAMSKQEKVLRYKQLVDELERLKEELGRSDVAKLESRSREYERLRERLERLRGQEKILKGSLDKIDVLRKQMVDVERIMEEEKRKRDQILAQVKEFEGLDGLRERLNSLKEYYERWLGLRDSEDRMRKKEEELQRIERELSEIGKEMEEKKREMENILKDLEERRRDYSEEEHERIRSEFVDRSKEVEALKSRVKMLVESVEQIERDLSYLEEQISILKEYERKLEIVEKKVIPELTRIREKFRKYKNIVAEAAMKEVEGYASEIFEELTEGKYSGVRLKKVTEKGKERLKIFVLYQGEERDTAFLSGGEMIALGLAFRLALSMFMIKGRIPLLILDEPTPYLDEERRRKLVDITTNYLRKIPQVVIVSHDDELKDAADRVIFVDFHSGASRVGYVETQ